MVVAKEKREGHKPSLRRVGLIGRWDLVDEFTQVAGWRLGGAVTSGANGIFQRVAADDRQGEGDEQREQFTLHGAEFRQGDGQQADEQSA